MNLKFLALRFAIIFLTTAFSVSAVRADGEYTGQFDTKLVAFTEDTERVIFKPASRDSLRGSKVPDEAVHLTSNRLINPVGASLVAVLVEEQDAKPLIFVDLNADNSFGDDEKFALRREVSDNPYLWITTVNVPMKDGFFTHCPIYIRYFRDYQTDKMTVGDRLLEQSTGVLARGTVDVKGKKVAVQYAYGLEDKKITPNIGWLGIDADDDGEIDMNKLSPEAARAADETIVFRIGQTYLSTKKADVGRNQIVLREHQAKDYKRKELAVGRELPDFSFVDLDGKKRRFSEFRGKYVLLDFWGFWCPPCLKELPYLREAYKRFQSRNFEIVGMNTDKYTPESIKKNLEQNGMTWTQARHDSFINLKDYEFRIESFPTTLLIAPDGKILSLSRQEKGEPDLRGKDLLETLDEILPKK
ncbi:MAG: hypothetical protein AVDCRST_MAG74-1323 [uncultured Pyrinomonadaceae bacterium]|uniref:Thioredoxin domain-containing protein n=1 Tax=uncultured Pyrinomonadaceae bacterium TaxID=2283094 RepID=A0A6J4N5K0_9BACT|nr:MAG: hypothetical protein AVDCRST_MAG74-1323 [uncultured Pyrinomonadaceae bacterium]